MPPVFPLAEWLYERGIGEDRAVLVQDGRIIEAAIERPTALRTGAIVPARLRHMLIPGKRAIAVTDAGDEILIEPVPPRVGEGNALAVEITREPIAETGRPKRAKGRVSADPPRPGPSLLDRLAGESVTQVPSHGPDLLEQAGWSELLDEAARGEIAFASGGLRMSLTPAMTLFDVDGTLDPSALALAGAEAAAQAIRRMGIGGSIGIDLPTGAGKDARQRVAAAIDAILPQPFERTAVNGFGFIQIVRRRPRASLPELLRDDPAGAAARALLRLAERTPGHGARTLVAAPSVIAAIEAEPDWIAELSRRTGTATALRAEAALAISAGHVHSAFA